MISDTLSVLMFLDGPETRTVAGAVAVPETPVEREEVSESETRSLAGQTAMWLKTSSAVSNFEGQRGH